MISCILLSAGFSQRFGSPKALAQLPSTTVIEYLLNNLLQTKLSDIIVVLGHQMEVIKPRILKHKRINIVYNKDYNFGQTSSFQTGLKALSQQANGMMLLPVDCPLIKPSTIDFLIESFQNPTRILVPSYQKKHGHPPIFSNDLKEEILSLPKDLGLNTIIHRHQNDTLYVETNDPGVVKSFNTREEFEDLMKDFV